MAEYLRYRRKQIAELADWRPGFDMAGVSVSDADKLAGSPKSGDKIARNPANHADRWLVAADYFVANFEPVADDWPEQWDGRDKEAFQRALGVQGQFDGRNGNGYQPLPQPGPVAPPPRDPNGVGGTDGR